MTYPDHQPASAADPAQTHGMPGWVKVFMIAGVIVVVIIAVMLATGHGPGRHLSHALATTVTAVA